MASSYELVEYEEKYRERWDNFVLNESANGTFLQTRKFLGYHEAGRFLEGSFMIFKGTIIWAVIPANLQNIDEKTYMYSHQGSTFGGLVIHKNGCNVTSLEKIFELLSEYLSKKSIAKITLKQTGSIFCNQNTTLLDYFFFMNGFQISHEVGFYIDYATYKPEIIENYTASRRRDYRYSLKKGFTFSRLHSKTDIKKFYEVLTDNYMKFDKTPVHTFDELCDLKHLFGNFIDFYGVFIEGELIAGGMVFHFADNVLHTQYLAVKQEYKNIYVNEFLYTNIIREGYEQGFKKLSFGTSTFEGGRVLNRNLAIYKESFGCQSYNNSSYQKIFE